MQSQKNPVNIAEKITTTNTTDTPPNNSALLSTPEQNETEYFDSSEGNDNDSSELIYSSSEEDEDAEVKEALKKFQLDRTTIRYENQCPVGTGTFTCVYKGTLRKTIPVAIKVPKEPPKNKYKNSPNKTLLNELKHFAQLSTKTNEPYAQYVVPFLGAFKKEENIRLVFSNCNGGQLSTRIEESPPPWLPWGRERSLEMAKGLTHLHSCNIIHCDFKTANVMLHTENNIERAMIIDLNLSDRHPNTWPPNGKGSPLYSPPEVLRNKPWTFKADVWGLGHAIAELKSGKFAFEEFNFNEKERLIDHVVTKKNTPKTPEDLTPDLKDMIQSCFFFEPEQRPDAKSVVAILENNIKTFKPPQ